MGEWGKAAFIDHNTSIIFHWAFQIFGIDNR